MSSHGSKSSVGLTTTVYTGKHAHVHVALAGETLGMFHRLSLVGYVTGLRRVSAAPTIQAAVTELLKWHIVDARLVVKSAETPAQLKAARRRLRRLLEVTPWWMR